MFLYLFWALFLLNVIFTRKICVALTFFLGITRGNSWLKEVIVPKTTRYKTADIKIKLLAAGYQLVLIGTCVYLGLYIVPDQTSIENMKWLSLLELNILFLGLLWFTICFNDCINYSIAQSKRIKYTVLHLKKHGLKLFKICFFINTRPAKEDRRNFQLDLLELHSKNGWWQFEELEIQIEDSMIKLRDAAKNITVYYSYIEFLRNFKK